MKLPLPASILFSFLTALYLYSRIQKITVATDLKSYDLNIYADKNPAVGCSNVLVNTKFPGNAGLASRGLNIIKFSVLVS